MRSSPLMFFCPDMESKLQEERSSKQQLESRLLQLEKDYSLLDCDYKQAQQRLEVLHAQKERLSEEVGSFPQQNRRTKTELFWCNTFKPPFVTDTKRV